MGSSSHIRDVLWCFSPNLDYFAITIGDGRIKIWDTGKAQVQAEFADIASTETTGIFGKQDEGHLSMDYTCMKWLSLEKKKKRKLGNSILILGTGGGDVLALDVSAGQLKWRVSNCHPGGVSSISFPAHGSRIYTAGADGMVCEIESLSGNLLKKFSASSKPISSLCVSPDGNTIATAEPQLKIFNSSSHKKLQKFSGHPGAVRCMIFSEDGGYLLSSSLGERYVALWKVDGSKKKSACAFLAMDHPAVFLDSKCISSEDSENAGIYVLAISEVGVCYFWHEKTVDELQNSKPTKISVPCDDEVMQKLKGTLPNVFAARLQSISPSTQGHLYLAHGLLIKPSFGKVLVQPGTDVNLDVSHEGILLPNSQSHKAKKSSGLKSKVTALDSSNAEGALLPVPMVVDSVDGKSQAEPLINDREGLDSVTLCMEERLRSLGILGKEDQALGSNIESNFLNGIKLDANTPQRKMRKIVSAMEPSDAIKLLKGLSDCWQSRSRSGNHVLPWIGCILVHHGYYIKSEEPKLLDSLFKVSKSRGAAMNSLLQLSGRLQLVLAQIDKALDKSSPVLKDDDEEEEESDDEDVDDVIHGMDDDSETDADNED